MVDATSALPMHVYSRTAPLSGTWRTEVLSGTQGIEAYRNLTDGLLCAPPQFSEWTASWAKAARADMAIVVLRDGAGVAAALAVEIVRKGPLKLARFPGGPHANGNFMPVAPARALGKAECGAMLDALGRARPDLDLILLDRLLPDLDGVANPLLALRHTASPDVALAVGLEGGFDALLERSSGKRKRKKHRAQIRKFEAVGPILRRKAANPVEAGAILDFFFAHKSARLKSMGVDDTFGDSGVQAFFRALFEPRDGQRFVLHALEVAGRIRAVTGSSISGKRLICEFGVIAPDDLAHASPGDFLFFENIAEACNEGFEVYDFSVGDEHFKRMWCNLETTQFRVAAGLTLKGKIAASGIFMAGATVRAVKSNPRLWSFIKRLRRRGKESGAPAESGES